MDEKVLLSLMVDKDVAAKIEEKGLTEIALRRSNAQFSSFVKCMVANSPESQTDAIKEVSAKALQLSTKSTNSIERVNRIVGSIGKNLTMVNGQITDISLNLKNMSKQVDGIFNGVKAIQSLSYLNAGLGIANLGVNIAGFVIIGKRLNDLQRDIQTNTRLLESLKQIEQNKKIARFESLVQRYNSMSDKIQYKEAINYDDLDYLISDINTFCGELITNIMAKTMDSDLMLRLVFTMLPAYTFLFSTYLVESKYEKNRIPTNYENYLSLYKRLIDSKFIDTIHDYLYFDMNLSNRDTISAQNAQVLLVLNSMTDILDLMKTMEALDSKEEFEQFDKAVQETTEAYLESILPKLTRKSGITKNECMALLKA